MARVTSIVNLLNFTLSAGANTGHFSQSSEPACPDWHWIKIFDTQNSSALFDIGLRFLQKKIQDSVWHWIKIFGSKYPVAYYCLNMFRIWRV